MEQDNHRKNVIEGRQRPKRRGSKDFGREAYEDDRYLGINMGGDKTYRFTSCFVCF